MGMVKSGSGKLHCVGIGMMLGAHLTPISRDVICKADVVFSAVSDPIVEKWIEQMNSNTRSLQPYYAQGKSRMLSYREMVESILNEVRQDLYVAGAFYGHPGVFAWVPHEAIRQAREQGYEASMVPGISAEDCLYADLGIDPGKRGCQHYEASQFMLYKRKVDPSAYLILWQIGMAGDRTLERFTTGPKERQLLIDILLDTYPPDHRVVLYEAACLPIERMRSSELRLEELANAQVNQNTTLVIPPSIDMTPNVMVKDQLRKMNKKRVENG